MPFLRKRWRRRFAEAEGRVTEAAYIDGVVIQQRRAYWARVRPLQAEVPLEFFARAPIERWRGSRPTTTSSKIE